MIYVMSDIHGGYDAYIDILKQINLKESDLLFVLGDAIDKGKGSIKLLRDMMQRGNVIPLIGNHEYMAMTSLEYLDREITEETINDIEPEILEKVMEWQLDGGNETIEEFKMLSREEQEYILEYLGEFELFDEIEVNGQQYILVHAGLQNFSPDRELDDYDISELIFGRPDYSKVYFKDKILVTGHTPTSKIMNDSEFHSIYKKNNHIAIDCGYIYGGKLGCICLDNGREYYSQV